MDPNSKRYWFEQKILSTMYGSLFHGKDLSLNRHVFLYQVQTTGGTSSEEALRMLAGVSHLTHPGFLHILDIGVEDKAVFGVIERREGAPLSEILEHQKHAFPITDSLSLVFQLAQSMQEALDERIRGFSVTAENVWIHEQRVMVINYWAEGEQWQRGPHGLISLFYQLLTGNTEVPVNPELLETQIRDSLMDLPIEQRDPMMKLIRRTLQGLHSISSFMQELGSLSGNEVEIRELPEPAEDLMKTMDVPPVRIQSETAPNPVQPEKRRFLPRAVLAFSAFLLGAVFLFFLQNLWSSEEEAMKPAPVVQAPAGTEQDQKPAEQTETEPSANNTADESNNSDEINDTNQNNDPVEELESGQTVTVPNLNGLTQAQAEQQALAAGLHYQFFLENNVQPSGVVFRQEPAAGTQVTKGSDVSFWVSKGN